MRSRFSPQWPSSSVRRSNDRSRLLRLVAPVLGYLILVLLAISMLIPYAYLVINALKPATYFYQHPFDLLPSRATLENYVDAWTVGRVGTFLRNSALYATIVTVVQLVVDSLAAFAFARLSFRGRDVLFVGLLATLMLPASVLLIPTYLIVHELGMSNSIPGVVVPSFVGVFGIFLLRQFFLSIPRELEDAARVDGASSLRIYWQIILPLSKPALITLGTLTFISEYGSYVWPLVVLSDIDLYPISVGIALFRQEAQVEWPLVFAASAISSAPLIVLFLIAQRFLIGGISMTGMKG